MNLKSSRDLRTFATKNKETRAPNINPTILNYFKPYFGRIIQSDTSSQSRD